LRKSGFSPYSASQITNEKVKVLDLKHLERLCLLLNCTPHDLLEWVPDTKLTEPNKFELSKLIRERKVVILSEELKGLPLDKLEEIHRFIEEKKREGV
jgi:DNA-binding Xre family transcriptional regulator